jgi:hypothetical protein
MSSSNNPRFSMFLRAIGLKPGFRRTGASSLVNIGVAALIGVLSAQYIWKEPLEQYWKEQHLLQQQEQEKQQQQQQQASNAGDGKQ